MSDTPAARATSASVGASLRRRREWAGEATASSGDGAGGWMGGLAGGFGGEAGTEAGAEVVAAQGRGL
jgi:hypothetical protein